MSAIDEFLYFRKETKVLNGIAYRDTLYEQAAAELAALRAELDGLKIAKDLASETSSDLRTENKTLRADNTANRRGWDDCYKVNCELRAELDEQTKAVDEARNIINHALPRIHSSKKNDEFCRDVHEWLDMRLTPAQDAGKWTCSFHAELATSQMAYLALRAENEKLKKTLCMDWNDRPVQLWKLFEELDAANKAVDHARIVLGIYANPDNWKSHDGYMYLSTMGHPWADARTWLTAHPRKEQE
jgi:hypothetical protein